MNRSLFFRVSSAFISLTLSLILVGCAALTPPSEASAHLGKEVQAAWWKTQTANTGRYEFTLRVNVEADRGSFGPYNTTLYGSFNHAEDSADFFVDLASSREVLPGVEASLPPELTPEIVHVRMVGETTWARAHRDGSWQVIEDEGTQDEIRLALLGPFDGILELLADATVNNSGTSDILGTNRFYSGHLGAPKSVAGAEGFADVDLFGLMFPFTMWLDEDGYAVELLVESDIDTVLEALGEATDEIVEWSYHLVWYDLDQPVTIEIPEL